MNMPIAEQRSAGKIRLLTGVSQRIASILDVDELLIQVVRLIQQTFGYYHVGIGLVEGNEVVYRVGAGVLWDAPNFQFKPARLKVGKEGLTGWVAATSQPLLIPDVSLDVRYVWMKGSKTRSELLVPITIKGQVIGVLDVQSDQLNDFDATDLELMLALANQAGVAIENARLFSAEQRRADQFRVLTEVSQRITSILDIDELLRQMVTLVQRTFGYYHIEIGLIEGDELVFPVGAGELWERSRHRTEPSRLKVGVEGITGWVAVSGKPFVVSDVSKEPRYIPLKGSRAKSELTIPIITKERVIGVMDVESDRLDAFNETDVELITSLANQAGVAIENARLFSAEQRRADQFRVLTEVSQHITSILDIDELLMRVVTLLHQTFGYYLVVLGMAEGDELLFHIGAGTLWNSPQFQGNPARLKIGKESVSGWVAATGEAVLVPDVSQEPRYVPIQNSRTRSEFIVPIKVGGKVIGILDVESDRLDAFDKTDVDLVTSLANQTSVAIENARLYKQARQVAVLEERQRLARDLHDSVTQSLYGLTLYSQAAAGQLALGNLERVAENLREIQDTSQEALAEMRLLIYELRPPVLEKEGLVAALQARLTSVEGRAAVKASFKAELVGRLPTLVEEGLYRIAQEALNNVLKHAHAQSISVSLRQDGPAVALEVVDDGLGFDPAAVQQGNLGLPEMRERALELGGQLTVSSKPGEGTRVRVDVKL